VNAPPLEKDPRSKKAGEAALRRFHEEEDIERVYDLRMLRGLWPYLRPHSAYLVGSILFLVVMACFALTRPLIMRAALQGFQQPGGAERLTRYGALLAAIIVSEQLLSFPQMYWMQIAGARSMADLRRKIFSFLHTRSLGFFDKTPIGRLVTRVTNDVDAVGEMFASGALSAVGDLIRLVGVVAIMLSLDWRMSLFAFAVLPFVAAGVNWTRTRMRKAYRDVRTKTARLNAFLNEQVSGVAVVQAYAREAQTETEFDDINHAYRDANMRAIVVESALDAAIEMVSSLCIATILWYAGVAHAVSPGIDFATLFAFVAYIDMFFMPVRDLSARYTLVQSALAGAERIFQLFDSREEDAHREGTAEPIATEGDIGFAFRGVTFGYKLDATVLHGIDLEARRGETIAVVGPTGSGKSTLASLLLRLYECQSGTVEVFGRDICTVDRSDLRRQFAVVPQDVFLFPGTIAENVAAGDPEPDRARVREVLDDVGALDLIERREGGIDARVNERGANFSAGERQLLALARALYRDPPIFILDEPTANIDSDTEARLGKALDAALAGRTALMIAHRLSTIKRAHRIVVMHQGRVLEQGTHDQLLELDGIYARLYRLQVARHALEKKVEELAEAV
jgi:ATP-binding cassette, subfamily B, multidrug efflux pump